MPRDPSSARKGPSIRPSGEVKRPKVGRKAVSTPRASKHPPLPVATETEVLVQSGRRCCICFVLRQDAEAKKGQIAHLDHNPKNNAIRNLAFLCLHHHDDYDGQTRQSKGLTIQEVKRYRDMLYQARATPPVNDPQVTGDIPSPSEVIAYWRAKGTERHRGLSDYLSAVAAEATALANYWNKIASALEQEIGKPNAASSNAVMEFAQLGLLSTPNPEYNRIVLHYRALSSTTGDIVTKEVRSDVVHALSTIIRAREELMDSLTNACQVLRNDDSLPEETLAQAKNALSALNWEAAALDVLAKRHKAKG